MPSYVFERDYTEKLVNTLHRLINDIERMPAPEHPELISALSTLVYGETPELHTNCPYDENCTITGSAPCGGIIAALEWLIFCLRLLNEEVELGMTEAEALADLNRGEADDYQI